MSGRTLPLYDNFFKTFQNHTIENWEAKKFIEYVLISHSKNINNRQKVYDPRQYCGQPIPLNS